MTVQRVQRRLQRLATRISRRIRQSGASLSPAQLSLLEALVNSGPMTVGALSRQERVSPPTISRIIDALEGRNLLRRARDKRDRRIVYAVATREGQGILDAFRRRPRGLEDLLFALDEKQICALDQKLEEIENMLFS